MSTRTCLGFVAGACTGAAIALLCAPASGARTRQRLRDAGTDATGRLREATEHVKEGAMEVKATVDRTVTENASRVRQEAQRWVDAVDRGREAFQESLKQA